MSRQVIRPVLSGKATVHCIHDRQKRIVTTERHVFDLGLTLGILYDPKQHKLHRCSCCENLFVDPSDQPRYCETCGRPPVHLQAGPLPEPEGVI